MSERASGPLSGARFSLLLGPDFRSDPISLHQSQFTSLTSTKRRKEGDSNPRDRCRPNGFQDRRIRPLCHPSGCDITRRLTQPRRAHLGRKRFRGNAFSERHIRNRKFLNVSAETFRLRTPLNSRCVCGGRPARCRLHRPQHRMRRAALPPGVLLPGRSQGTSRRLVST